MSAVGGLVVSKFEDVVVGDVVSKVEGFVVHFVGGLVILHVDRELERVFVENQFGLGHNVGKP